MKEMCLAEQSLESPVVDGCKAEKRLTMASKFDVGHGGRPGVGIWGRGVVERILS